MRNDSDRSGTKMAASLWLSIKKNNKNHHFDEMKPLMSAGGYNSDLSPFFGLMRLSGGEL